MSLYVVSYNRLTGAARLEEFPGEDRAAAMCRRFELERNSGPEDEVVVLGADSQDALMRTHARYFSGVTQMARSGMSRVSRSVAQT
jgi:hypothetical protein